MAKMASFQILSYLAASIFLFFVGAQFGLFVQILTLAGLVVILCVMLKRAGA